MTRRAALLALSLSLGCGGAPHRGGTASARTYFYTDNSGLSVSTTAVEAQERIGDRWSAGARGVVDWIRVEREPLEVEYQAGNQSTGHVHADTVTSASAFVKGGAIAEKWRVEGTGNAGYRGGGESPWEVTATGRFGKEPDYESASGLVSARAELFERNTVIAASLGAGHDTVSPVEAPPGQASEWPASHDRVLATATLTQLLAPWAVATAGGSFVHQRGQLANPYRRAIVRTSLFPEQVPDTRTRFVGFLGLSAYVMRDTALHFRQGFYADDWGVAAIVPEVAAAHELGGRVVVRGRYRFYRQTHAWFYEPRYEDLAPLLSGDLRLGALHDHTWSAEVRVTVLGETPTFGPLVLLLGYEMSLLRYQQVATDTIVSHIPNVGLSATY